MMAEWFEVYEDAAGLSAAQMRLRRLAVGFALASGAIVAGAPVAALTWPTHSLAVAVAAGTLVSGHVAWLVWHAARARRDVWRLDVSVHHVVGHDVSRQRRVLAWPDVAWVDVGDAGVEIVGRRMGRRVRFVVPAAFPDFTRTSGNRVVRYAEAFRPPRLRGRPADRGASHRLAATERQPAGAAGAAGLSASCGARKARISSARAQASASPSAARCAT